jgi:hypothetical protein
LEFNEEVNSVRDLNLLTEILILGDMNSRTGDKQVNLPYAWDPYGGADREDYNFYNSRTSMDKICNLEGNKFIEFCETSLSDSKWWILV